MIIDQFELVTFYNEAQKQQIVLVYALAGGEVYEYRGDHWLRLLPLVKVNIKDQALVRPEPESDGRVNR